MPVDRVVPDEIDRAVRDEVGEPVPGAGAPQRQPRPLGRRQNPAIAGRVPRGQVADGPEQVRHRPAAGGQDGGRGEDDEPGLGRVGEVREERRHQRPGLGGEEQGGHPWAAMGSRSHYHATHGTAEKCTSRAYAFGLTARGGATTPRPLPGKLDSQPPHLYGDDHRQPPNTVRSMSPPNIMGLPLRRTFLR